MAIDFPFPLTDEPIERFDDRYCHDALTSDPVAYLDALAADIAAIADGRLAVELPPKQLFDDPEPSADSVLPGDFRVMPCVVRGDGRTTKTVKIVGSNFHRRTVRERITVGHALLLDPLENFVSADFAAFALSSARTGACAALAMRSFAAGRSLSVYGAGPVGWYAAFFAAADGGIDALRFVDPQDDRAEVAARSIAALFPNVAVTVGSSAGREESSTSILATDSRSAFMHPARTRSLLIVSLGADSDRQAELDSGWATQGRIVVDLADSALIGDLRRWTEQGLIDAESLPTLLDGDSKRNDARPLVFVSTGSALFDNLTIHYLMTRRGRMGQEQCETKSSNLPPGPAGIESQ